MSDAPAMQWVAEANNRWLDSGQYRILPMRGEYCLLYGQLWSEMHPTLKAAKARAAEHHAARRAPT